MLSVGFSLNEIIIKSKCSPVRGFKGKWKIFLFPTKIIQNERNKLKTEMNVNVNGWRT